MSKTKRKKKGLLRRVAAVSLCAVIFGVLASLTFVLTRPWFENNLSGLLPDQSQEFTLSKDTESTSAPSTEEVESDAAGTSSLESDTTEQTTEPVTEEETTTETIEPAETPEEMDIEPPEETSSSAAGDLVDISQVLKGTNSGLVKINKPMEDTWDPENETDINVTGVIVDISDDEILILTDLKVSDWINSSGFVEINFSDVESVNAIIKQRDSLLNMAMLSVPKSQITDETLEKVNPITFGNSYLVKEGDIVALIGNPTGQSGSVTVGRVAYVKASQPGIDTDFRTLYCDISLSKEGSGFLINLDGEIIGIAGTGQEDTESSLTGIIAISDLKATIEKLSNGRAVAYLGIEGLDVTEEVTEKTGTPTGVYVRKTVSHSPAYNGIILSGDVIVAIGDTEISTMTDLQRALESCEPGQMITVTVMRVSVDNTYVEVSCGIKLESR